MGYDSCYEAKTKARNLRTARTKEKYEFSIDKPSQKSVGLSKKDGKDQASIQSSITSDPG